MASFFVPPLASEVFGQGKEIEYLVWEGCAVRLEDKQRRIIDSFYKILDKAGVSFAVLGPEESCTGDPLKRMGNEYLFQSQALKNIQTLNRYGVKRLVTVCPHCFNAFKNEYSDLGGIYEVYHHTELLDKLIETKKLSVREESSGFRVTYHDPCYLARVNGIVDIPRRVLKALKVDLQEMKQCKKKALCCGGGGGQIFKESEAGALEINQKRRAEALATGAEVVVTACPFCKIMLSEGEAPGAEVKDLAEVVEGMVSKREDQG